MAGNRDERLEQLSQRLADGGVLHLRDVAELLGVSEMTVRRDLAAAPGRFSFFGGHVMLGGGEGPYDLGRAADRDAPAKKAACLHALTLLRPEETIFIDCGSTLEALADNLPSGLNLTVVTYALNIAEKLAHREGIRLLLAGGLYHPASASFEGPEVMSLINRTGITTAFLSAAGIDREHGASCANFHEADVKMAAIARARRVVLVVDRSKFDRLRPALFAPLDAIDFIAHEEGLGEPSAVFGPGIDAIGN